MSSPPAIVRPPVCGGEPPTLHKFATAVSPLSCTDTDPLGALEIAITSRLVFSSSVYKISQLHLPFTAGSKSDEFLAAVKLCQRWFGGVDGPAIVRQHADIGC